MRGPTSPAVGEGHHLLAQGEGRTRSGGTTYAKDLPIILHHFDESPFSEKIRLIFGLKSLAWTSVRITRIMPRPDLMLLTGGIAGRR